jgi:hypothetical protein
LAFKLNQGYIHVQLKARRGSELTENRLKQSENKNCTQSYIHVHRIRKYIYNTSFIITLF